MSIPTIGEQQFQAQLLDALSEIADAIRENTKAVREFTGVLQATARETCKDDAPQPKREKHLSWASTSSIKALKRPTVNGISPSISF